MDGEVRNNKYLTNQTASVHTYTKLSKAERPRAHTSPTSILRKFPQSLRHDQKHQTKIKRNSSPVATVIRGHPNENGKRFGRDVKSWCMGDSEGTETDSEIPLEIAPGKKIQANGLGESARREETICKYKNSNGNEFKSVHDFDNELEDACSPRKDVVLSCSQVAEEEEEEAEDTTAESTSSEQRQQPLNDKLKLGSIKKLSVINNSLNEYKNVSEKFWCSSVDKISEFNKILSPVHKSTPNLLRSGEPPFAVSSAVSHPERITDRLSRVEYFDVKETLRDEDNQNGNGRDRGFHFRNSQQVPLKGSDSLPQLNHKYRIINSILPKINRTISESHESLNSPKKVNLQKSSCIKSDSQVGSNLLLNAVNRSDSYRLLSDPADECELTDECQTGPKLIQLNGEKSDSAQSEDESERISLINNQPNIVIQPACESRQETGKSRWTGKRTVEIMPSLKNLMRRNRGGKSVANCDSISQSLPPPSFSIPLMTPTSGSCSSLNSTVIPREDDLPIKKCDTMYALSDLFRTESSLQIEPMKPINRLRVPPNGFGGSMSRMCSRCSSLLSMASSSRYSINTTGSGFVPCSPSSEKAPEPIMLCKLCLMEVPLSQSMEINHCGCVFCRDCMKLYVEFEIQEGAYDISCPDAQCHKQGIVTVNEVESLVATQMMERYMRFRLNHEVDLDRNRTWCPRAGCETVCNICPREKCSPTSVHCPTCDSDFCSNCKNPWHRGLTCEENLRKLAKEGHTDFMEPGIPFDSDLIKCCPMCNVPIEKNEGCAQMMCKRCKHVFCWYCLASLDDDFLLRHYDKGPCKNKLGHSRASVIWHRTQVIGIFAGFGILLLVASPLLLVAAPCIVCCKCRVCSGTKMDPDEDLPEESGT